MMFSNFYIARPTCCFILMYTCGLTVVFKRICYIRAYVWRKLPFLPLTISGQVWRTRCTSFVSERRYSFTIVRQMAPLPSGLSAAVENDVTATVELLLF